jgi:hypothetical protein
MTIQQMLSTTLYFAGNFAFSLEIAKSLQL